MAKGHGSNEAYLNWAKEKAPMGIIHLMQAKAFGFQEARQFVIDGGISLPPIPNSKLGRSIEKIADMLCDGLSAYAISKELGADKAGVARFCHSQGLELPQRYTVDVAADEVRRMLDEGKSYADIAEETGFSQGTVSAWCKKHGLKARDPYHQGIIIAKGKYILVSMPEHPAADGKGYVRLHRLVAEAKLGRYLDDKEMVHHIDGNTFNEDPDNLEITSKSKHASIHNARGDIGWTKYHSKRKDIV